MDTNNDGTWAADETWLALGGDTRVLDRVARRARRPQFQPNLAGEDYRRQLLEHIDTIGNADTTDQERADTAKWRQTVSEASAEELRTACSPSR